MRSLRRLRPVVALELTLEAAGAAEDKLGWVVGAEVGLPVLGLERSPKTTTQ